MKFKFHSKYGQNLSPWVNGIDGDPPVDGGASTGTGVGEVPVAPLGEDKPADVDVNALLEQISALQTQNDKSEALVQKLRPFERRWNQVAGDISPDRLQELKDADQRLAQIQQEQEQKVLAIRTEVTKEITGEYQPKLDTLTEENRKLTTDLSKAELRYDIFKAFQFNGGIGDRFNSFLTLANP